MNNPESLEDVVRRLCSVEAPLSERLKLFSEALNHADPRYTIAYDQLIGRLQLAKIGRGAPEIGDLLPPFALPDGYHRLHRLQDYLARGPLVLSFNRGHWCPYCLVELSALKQSLTRISKSGASVVSIMPETPEYVAKVAAEVGHSYDILSDRNNGYALSLDLVMWVGDAIKELLISDGIDLDVYQQNEAAFLPLPATFIVSKDGRIIGRFVDPDYRRRMEIDRIIDCLDKV
ncbi:MAG: peroxiredoxin-like family protein [Hyphomicrobium sp.]